MTKSPLAEMMDDILEHKIWIISVGSNIAEWFLEQGDVKMALLIAQLCSDHDYSKFEGIEWESLNDKTKKSNKEQFKEALEQHQSLNEHHPEFWLRKKQEMPEEFIIEMVIDWFARSLQLGFDFDEWMNETRKIRWNFSPSEEKLIVKYSNLIKKLWEKEMYGVENGEDAESR